MIRNVKAFGLALVAVAAVSMMAAVGAQGAELHVNTPQKAVLTGEQTVQHEFQITSANAGPKVKCGQALFEATVQGGSPQITTSEAAVTATYTGCTFLGLAAQVTLNGCKFILTGANKPALTADVDITDCTTNVDQQHKSIEVHVPGCTLTIPQQHTKPHIVFTPGVDDVTAHITVSQITYQTHGAACAHQPETVLKHDATYHGVATFKGFQHGGIQVASHNGHQYNKAIPGTQVALLGT